MSTSISIRAILLQTVPVEPQAAIFAVLNQSTITKSVGIPHRHKPAVRNDKKKTPCLRGELTALRGGESL